MKIEYDYHIKVDDKVIFLGAKLEVHLKGKKDIKLGTLEKIGPKGMYMNLPGLKNIQFINFNNIEIIKEV